MADQVDFVEAGEDFLAHFGKRGMKWGYRSSKANSDSKTKSSRGRKIGSSIKRAVLSKNGVLAAVAILGVVGHISLDQIHGVEDQAKALTNDIEKDTAKIKYQDLELKLGLAKIR
jgi:hypothetical protein